MKYNGSQANLFRFLKFLDFLRLVLNEYTQCIMQKTSTIIRLTTHIHIVEK